LTQHFIYRDAHRRRQVQRPDVPRHHRHEHETIAIVVQIGWQAAALTPKSEDDILRSRARFRRSASRTSSRLALNGRCGRRRSAPTTVE
jgi:hypothetical protein